MGTIKKNDEVVILTSASSCGETTSSLLKIRIWLLSECAMWVWTPDMFLKNMDKLEYG